MTNLSNSCCVILTCVPFFYRLRRLRERVEKEGSEDDDEVIFIAKFILSVEHGLK